MPRIDDLLMRPLRLKFSLWKFIFLGITAEEYVRSLFSHERETLLWFIVSMTHRAGHALFDSLGFWMKCTAGTITQISVPLALFVLFWRLRKSDLSIHALFWLSSSFMYASVYAGDANELNLHLPGFWETPSPAMMYAFEAAVEPDTTAQFANTYHDWHILLGALGCLNAATLVAKFLYLFAVVCCVAAIYLGLLYAGVPVPNPWRLPLAEPQTQRTAKAKLQQAYMGEPTKKKKR